MSLESPSNKKGNTYGEAPKEWKDYFNTFGDIRKRVLTKIFSLGPEEQAKYLGRLRQKQNESFDSVSNPEKYLTYHKSIGGSVGPIDAPNLDFAGEHSLLKFYEDLDKEIE